MEKERRTKRRYVATVTKSRVIMKEAVLELSANAFKLLSLIYYENIKDGDLADEKACRILGVSRRPYFKAKEELTELGYLRIVQVGSTKYKWYIGKKAIKKDSERFDIGRSKKSNYEFSQKVLNYYNINNTDDEPITQTGTGVYEIAI